MTKKIFLVIFFIVLTSQKFMTKHSKKSENCSLGGRCDKLPKGDSRCITNYALATQVIDDNGKLTIHGLWPGCDNNCDTRKGAFCCNGNYSPQLTVDPSLVDKLNEIWPSSKGDNPYFWDSEYKKHGSCVVPRSETGITNHNEYFQKVISLYDSMNLSKVYPTIEHFEPSDKDIIEVTIKQIAGFRPKVTPNGEIHFCLDNLLKLYDCDGKGKKDEL
jgi:ribonuclease I